MRSTLLGLVSGLIFGVGLLLAGMTQPAKVVHFLDVTREWDPSLGLVMGGAIGVHVLAYRLVPRMQTPLWATKWTLPTRKDIDARLLIGAALFGAGWGLGGYCPGPALTAIPSGATSTLIFAGSMLLGMGAWALWEGRTSTNAPTGSTP